MRYKYKNVVNINRPIDYACLQEYISELCANFDFLQNLIIGKSYLGRNINLLKLGSGERASIFIGAHHSMEWITSLLLMRFAETLCKGFIFSSHNEKLYGYDIEQVFKTRTIYIVPMLNPDGVDLVLNGLDDDNPVRSRLIQMNNGSHDFSRWQANARGVDLNHNYDADFELLRQIETDAGITEPCAARHGGPYPESEPETSALAAFIRSRPDIGVLSALHTQGEEIYWRYGDIVPPRARMLASLIKRITGYKLKYPDEALASYGGCKDWFIAKFNKPGFTIECGKGENPLPLADFMPIYSVIEEALVSLAVN